MLWKIIGSIAAFLTMFGFVPQAVKVYRTKSAKDVSILTLLQFSLGTVFWITYGLYLKDVIIIAANIVTLTTLAVLILMYFIYTKSQPKRK
jgi:MtN3 and saliva related transmembrane protein